MSRDAKYPDAVKRFMAFLASEEFIEWLQGEAQPPISRRSVALEYIKDMDPRDVAILNALEYGRIRPRHQYWRDIEGEFARANGKIFAQNQPVELVLEETARLIREVLAQKAEQ